MRPSLHVLPHITLASFWPIKSLELPSILSKNESAQDELECLDDADYSLDREEFENQYYKVEARFHELLHLVVDPPLSRHSSTSSSLSGHSDIPQLHGGSPNIVAYNNSPKI